MYLKDFLFFQVYSNTPETINLIIEVFVEVAHKQICYLGEVRDVSNLLLNIQTNAHLIFIPFYHGRRELERRMCF